MVLYRNISKFDLSRCNTGSPIAEVKQVFKEIRPKINLFQNENHNLELKWKYVTLLEPIMKIHVVELVTTENFKYWE